MRAEKTNANINSSFFNNTIPTERFLFTDYFLSSNTACYFIRIDTWGFDKQTEYNMVNMSTNIIKQLRSKTIETI